MGPLINNLTISAPWTRGVVDASRVLGDSISAGVLIGTLCCILAGTRMLLWWIGRHPSPAYKKATPTESTEAATEPVQTTDRTTMTVGDPLPEPHASSERLQSTLMGALSNLETNLMDRLSVKLNDFQAQQKKSSASFAADVRKELAQMLNQRPPASVADIKALDLSISNARAEIKAISELLQEVAGVTRDAHQSSLDSRVEFKADSDSLARQLTEAATRADGIAADVRSSLMVTAYIQNLQSALSLDSFAQDCIYVVRSIQTCLETFSRDATWHLQEAHQARIPQTCEAALENTRMLGEQSEESHQVLVNMASGIDELLGRLLPARVSAPPASASQAHCPPPAHNAGGTGSSQAMGPGSTSGTGASTADPCPINLTQALRFKSPPSAAPPNVPAPTVMMTPDYHSLRLAPEDLARLLLVIQQQQFNQR